MSQWEKVQSWEWARWRQLVNTYRREREITKLLHTLYGSLGFDAARQRSGYPLLHSLVQLKTTCDAICQHRMVPYSYCWPHSLMCYLPTWLIYNIFSWKESVNLASQIICSYYSLRFLFLFWPKIWLQDTFFWYIFGGYCMIFFFWKTPRKGPNCSSFLRG